MNLNYLLASSKLCCQALSGSKLFGTRMVFLKELINLKTKSAGDKNHARKSSNTYSFCPPGKPHQLLEVMLEKLNSMPKKKKHYDIYSLVRFDHVLLYQYQQ